MYHKGEVNKMEMRCAIKIYQYQNNTGNFSKLTEAVTYEDINMSAKQLFEKVMSDKQELLKNKFFIMEVDSSDDISDSHNFYSIRTDINCKINEIDIAGPNNLDKSMLIDAIVGCSPMMSMLNTKLVTAHDRGKCMWVPDVKDRLQKMNVLRLKEIYEKLKS